jgi:hypothetical protein
MISNATSGGTSSNFDIYGARNEVHYGNKVVQVTKKVVAEFPLLFFHAQAIHPSTIRSIK